MESFRKANVVALNCLKWVYVLIVVERCDGSFVIIVYLTLKERRKYFFFRYFIINLITLK